MKITILGTGTSTGVPQIGCQCAVCTSSDPRDRRLRCSALFETEKTTLLVDCGPDFREQMLHIGMRKAIDACLITHEHYDHVGGIDDLRPFSYLKKLTLYADSYSARHLRERLPYCLVRNVYPGVPQLQLEEVNPHDHFTLGDVEVTVLQVMHGQLPILGYRIGDVGYITDMKTMPETELELLQDLKLLIVNGLRQEPHPTHQTIDEAIQLSRRLGSPTTYIIHMSHHAGLHAETDAQLPEGIHLAWDFMTLEV